MAFVKYQSSEKIQPVKKDELLKSASTEKPKLADPKTK